MSQLQQSAVRNRLLRGLSRVDFDAVAPFLRPIRSHLRQVLIAPNSPIRQMCFPESGFVSVTTVSSGNRIEIGMVGPEGLVGASPVLLGGEQSPYEHFVQSPGELLCIGTQDLMAAVDRSPLMLRLLLRYVETLLVQTAQTAFVNASHSIETRLARWLLMCQDRLETSEMTLTHEFLAMMLGVQRTSVTLALQTLESGGSIRARRGRVEMRDRDQLRHLAGQGYGLPEAVYARLIDDA